jgi:PAS domain S-box-containing protein
MTMMPSAPTPDLPFFTALLDASPDCVVVLSADGGVLYMNERALAVARNHVAVADILGKPYETIWPVEEHDKIGAAIKAAAQGSVEQIDVHGPTSNGESRWWEVRFAPMAAAHDSTQVVAIARDISLRRHAAVAARVDQERFSLLLESSGDGIYGMALDGSCTFVNRAGATMLGYEARALIGLSLHEVIHHHRADQSPYPLEECNIFKAAQSGMSRRIDDEVFWHKDGHAIPVTYSVFPMTVDGVQMGTVVTYSDTSERRRVEDELRSFSAELSEADRRKTEFLATLAHELRNPLAPLRNGLALLAKAGDRPEAIAKVRDMMERQLAQMVHLINDLLDIARITTGKMELQCELCDLNEIVTTAAEASGPAIRNGAHHLKLDMPVAPVIVRADPTRLTQVFTNLLNNAAKYTPPAGRIELRRRLVDGFVEIQLTDNGIGIPKASLGAIFDMFTQVGRNSSALRGGLGIGLNLVRRLVELHGGTVMAESAGAALGSTFTVRLPLALAGADSDPVVAAHDAAPVGRRILVVDDNVDAAESMGMLLSLGLHTTRVAHSGIEALKIATEFRPDIAFLDIGMPVMNGYELAKRMRALPGFEHLKLVALTGWGGEDDRKRTSTAGFDDHLTKPADLGAVERLLAKQS